MRSARDSQSEQARSDLDDVLYVPKSAITFLRLPRELRDHIYDIIWSQKPPFQFELPRKFKLSWRFQMILNAHCDFFTITYGKAPVRPDAVNEPELVAAKSPPWTLACKQILKEALEQFYHKAKWTYTGQPDFTCTRHLAAWRPRSSRQKPVLLTLMHASNIELTIPWGMEVRVEMGSRDTPKKSVSFDGDAKMMIRCFMKSLAGTTILRYLSVILNVSMHHSVKEHFSELPTIVELQNLEELEAPNLQTLLIKLRCHDLCLNDAMVLRESLSQTGKTILGPQTRLTVKDFARGGTDYTFERL